MAYWFMTINLFHLFKYFRWWNQLTTIKYKAELLCLFFFLRICFKRKLTGKVWQNVMIYLTHIQHHYITSRRQDVITWISKLGFEVDPIVVLQVWIIDVPVSPFPKWGCHFIQKLALCFATEYDLSEALSSGRFLLPELLLVSSLFIFKIKKLNLTRYLQLTYDSSSCNTYKPCVGSKGHSAASWTYLWQILHSFSSPSWHYSKSDFCLAAELD